MTRLCRRRLTVTFALAVLTVLASGAVQSFAAPRSPLIMRHRDAVAGRYIVVLRQGPIAASARGASVAVTASLVAEHGGTVVARFGSALPGYAARMTRAQAAETSRDPRVAYVEQDTRVTIDTTQSSPTWGLDRIDQRALPLDHAYTYGSDGQGVTAYVIDTGIRTTHSDFGGRAVSGFDAVDGGTADDCQGHGTHVAGTIGGTTWGVAKKVSLVAVRVLDCSGSGYTSDVISGIDWVTADHDPGEAAVANLSLGGSASSAMDQAIANAVADGVVFAVAAGNGDSNGNARDACQESPSRAPSAITVSAVDKTDTRPTWANVGSCVDLFAPGVAITSTYLSSDSATATMSGTSMAAPHVAGVAALYLSANPGATPGVVATALESAATTGVVNSAGSGSPNLLVFEAPSGAPPSPTPTPTPTPTTAPPPPSSISLSATHWSNRRGSVVKLRWDGATGATVDIQRGGVVTVTTTNDGAMRDKVGRMRARLVYRVCQAGTQVCSNSVSVRV
jgi:subtilisin family serine protease